MIRITGRDDLHRIVVLNPKGGCGKTTLSTNLASALALRGSPPTLLDCDPQGYVTSWIDRRPAQLPEVYGIRCCDEQSGEVPRSLNVRIPDESHSVIVDMPAAIPRSRLYEYTHLGDTLLIPIQPSEIEVHSATRFIAELLLDAQLDRRAGSLAIVANRVRARTRSYERLMRFLTSLRIPLIATFRDSQNFVYAAANGIGVCELPSYRARQDVPQIERVMSWIDKRRTIATSRIRSAAGSVEPVSDRHELVPVRSEPHRGFD